MRQARCHAVQQTEPGIPTLRIQTGDSKDHATPRRTMQWAICRATTPGPQQAWASTIAPSTEYTHGAAARTHLPLARTVLYCARALLHVSAVWWSALAVACYLPRCPLPLFPCLILCAHGSSAGRSARDNGIHAMRASRMLREGFWNGRACQGPAGCCDGAETLGPAWSAA